MEIAGYIVAGIFGVAFTVAFISFREERKRANGLEDRIYKQSVHLVKQEVKIDYLTKLNDQLRWQLTEPDIDDQVFERIERACEGMCSKTEES